MGKSARAPLAPLCFAIIVGPFSRQPANPIPDNRLSFREPP